MDPNAHEQAVGMAREAEEIHRAEKRARRETQRRLNELRLFCAANDIDFVEVRTEAKGHGPREQEAN
jgi:hypothetical protein